MKKETIVLITLIIAACAAAGTITVDDDNPADYTTIQAAIDDANDGDIVQIQPGTYTGEGNRDISFRGKAITVTSTDPTDPDVVAATVIDCLRSPASGPQFPPYSRGFNFHDDEGPSSVLAGITIINGGRWDDGSTTCIRYGGAIRCSQASPTITHCNFFANKATYGGAICSEAEGRPSYRDSSPVITHCTIKENEANWGAGIYAYGGHPTITHCSISNNTSLTFGGGICLLGGSSPFIHNCLIAYNSTENNGGGICLCASETSISRCTISGCTIINNVALEYGGGIHFHYAESQIQNSIVSGNTAPQGPQISAAEFFTTTVLHCNVQGGFGNTYAFDPYALAWGAGNIDTDPMFANPAEYDFHLQPGSPCIDAGDPNYLPMMGETDIDGELRVMGISIDMGYDETSAFPTPIIGLSATSFSFRKIEGAPEPNDQAFQIHNAGYGELTWTIASSAPWLTVEPSGGASTGQPNDVTVGVDTGGLSPTDYYGELVLTGEGASNSPVAIPVTLILGACRRTWFFDREP